MSAALLVVAYAVGWVVAVRVLCWDARRQQPTREFDTTAYALVAVCALIWPVFALWGPLLALGWLLARVARVVGGLK